MGPGKSQYIFLFSHLVFVGSGGPVRATPPAFRRVAYSDFATPLLNCVSESPSVYLGRRSALILGTRLWYNYGALWRAAWWFCAERDHDDCVIVHRPGEILRGARVKSSIRLYGR